MRQIIISCLFITVLQTIVLGGETEVEVLQGKVRGRTAQTIMTISAGQKGLVREGQEPIIAINEPLVQQAIDMYRWVEEERKSGKTVEIVHIGVVALDDEQAARSAFLVEKINDGSEVKSVIQLGPMSALKDLRIYDFEGNLLKYEVKQPYEHAATYFIYPPEPVEPGETIRFITVSPSLEYLYWLSSGPVWSVTGIADFGLKPILVLGKVILPKSAILLETYPKAHLVEKVDDRIALTLRIDDAMNSRIAISFLWPDKDGTSLKDIPPEMRGLQDPQQARLIQDAHKQMKRIIDGQPFADHSTPMNSFLSVVFSLFHDLDEAARSISKASGRDLEQVRKSLVQYRNLLVDLDVHSFSSFAAESKPGDTAWIKLRLKGTFKPIATAEFICMDGSQWKLHAGDFFPSLSPSDTTAKKTDSIKLYSPTTEERARGFVAVQGSGPEPHVRLNKLEVDLGRQECDLVPITLAPLSEPDTVSIQITGPGSKLCKVLVGKDYQLHPGIQTPLDVNNPTQFWLEVNSGNLDHGSYDLMVRLSSSHGTELKIPGTITIHDVTLPQRRTIRMKPFSWIVSLSGVDIHKPETRKRLEVFLDDLEALRNPVCDWVYTYQPANVLPHVKIAGTDQTLQAAGQASVIDINNLPDLDFSFFDPWIAGSVKHGMTQLEINVRMYITENERSFFNAVLGNEADYSDETCWKLLMWLHKQFRDYAISRGMTETWARIVHESPSPETIPDYVQNYVQTARRYQKIGYRTYNDNIDAFARNATWLNQLNAQSDAWYMSYWQVQAFLELTSKAWEYEKKRETVGTKWAPYDNGGAVSTWCTPKPFFSEDIAHRVQDVVISVNDKPLKHRSGSGWGNKERGVYMHWGDGFYVCLPDGGNPNEVKMEVNYTLRQPTDGKPTVQLDKGDQIWHAASGDYTFPYEKARANAWRACTDGTHGYSWWCYWLDNSERCIVWYDQENECMIHSPTWHGLRDGNEDAAYYYILQERLKAKADQEGLARLAALTGKTQNAPLRMTKARDHYGFFYHDIDPTNGYRKFNQAKREILRMLCADQ